MDTSKQKFIVLTSDLEGFVPMWTEQTSNDNVSLLVYETYGEAEIAIQEHIDDVDEDIESGNILIDNKVYEVDFFIATCTIYDDAIGTQKVAYKHSGKSIECWIDENGCIQTREIKNTPKNIMSKTTQELETQAEGIMSNFDFERVHQHMVENDRQWYLGNGKMGVPDISDMRVTARDLITKAIYADEPCTNVGTGGFVAYKLPWGIQLTFQLTWSSGY